MKCRAIYISENDLVDPSCVPFFPSWTIVFNNMFSKDYPDTSDVQASVEKWIDDNACGRVSLFKSGEVICEYESDALLFYMAFC